MKANWEELVEIRDLGEVGRGLFARKSYAAESTVFELLGRIVTDDGYESDTCVDLDGDARMEPEEPYRLLNHSCDPNCELVMWKTQRVGEQTFPRLWLDTLRDIEPGEQLTIDYAWPADVSIPCCCGTSVCRGWIVSRDEIDQLPAPPAASV